MTTMDHDAMPFAGLEAQRRHFRLLHHISNLVAALQKRRTRTKAYQQLSALDEHLLRDIGLNPQDLRDALENRRSSMLFSPFRAPYEKD
jgi:uncharacterized protein YjiS (DUF1127 family)